MNPTKIILPLLLLAALSCEKEEVAAKRLVDDYSRDYFIRKKIDTTGYKRYYKVRNYNGYIMYSYIYYKLIGKNDSIVIYFTRDNDAEYFVDGNDNFFKYELGVNVVDEK